MAVLAKVEAVVQKVAQYAETLTTAAAAATAAFDPTVLPPKWAASYAAVAGATRVAREYVSKGAQELPVVEAQASHFLPLAESLLHKVEAVPAELKAQVVAPVAVLPAPDPADVNSPVAIPVPGGATGVPVPTPVAAVQPALVPPVA